MSNDFRMDTGDLSSRLTEAQSRFIAAVYRFAVTGANQLEAYAKENARWQDRTGDARRRLKGSTLEIENGYKLKLAHGVDYGIWLELAMERRYAIIEETIQRVGQEEIMPAFQGLLSQLGG